MLKRVIKSKKPKVKAIEGIYQNQYGDERVNHMTKQQSKIKKSIQQQKPTKNHLFKWKDITETIKIYQNKVNLFKKTFEKSDKHRYQNRQKSSKSIINLPKSINQQTEDLDYVLIVSLQNRKYRHSLNNRNNNLNKTISEFPNRNIKSSISNKHKSNSRDNKQSLSVNKSIKNQSSIDLVSLLQEAKLYYREQKIQKAIQQFQKVLKYKKIVEAQYFLAISYVNLQQYQKGINRMKNVIKQNVLYNKNVYILMAIAYKKLNKISQSIQILTQGIKHFSSFFEAYLYRAKLYLKQKKWNQSLKDFNTCIQLKPEKNSPYIGKAEVMMNIGNLNQAIKALNISIQQGPNKFSYLKRLICYYKLSQFQNAFKDIQGYLKYYPCTNQIFLYSGIILHKLKKNSQALLNLQQIIKGQQSEYFTKAMQEIIKIKIEQRNLYDAYHILQQSNRFPLIKTELQDLFMFVEASINLTKKKYQEGIDILTKLLISKKYNCHYNQDMNISQQTYNLIKPLIYLYRAYAYLTLGNVSNAKLDYIKYDQFCFKNMSFVDSNHKIYNCLIIKTIQQFPNCQQYLIQCIKIYPNKSQPFFFLALAYMQKYLLSLEQSLILAIKNNLDIAISLLPQLSNNHIANIYYHRAILNLYCDQYTNALVDIDKAIQKSQDNVAKYYYLRGMIFQVCSNYQQAVKDISISIRLNPEFAKSYLLRAKCLQMLGNTNQSFLDLQIYSKYKPDDMVIHKYATYFLFKNRLYEDCLLAFQNWNQYRTDCQTLIIKAKSQILLNKFKQAIISLEKFHQQSTTNKYVIDVQILQCIQKIIKNSKSKQNLEQLKKKLQKYLLSKTREGKIFKQSDIYMIKGGINACLGNYKLAITDFENALLMKHKNEMYNENNEKMENYSVQYEDKFEQGWTSFQLNYCISICYVCLHQYQRAQNVFQKIWKKCESYLDKNWIAYRQILNLLKTNTVQQFKLFQLLQQIQIDPNQNIFSKFLPTLSTQIQTQNTKSLSINLSLLFNYPQILPQQLPEEFDIQLFMDFHINKVQYKPQAPWIIRDENGVIFTSRIQIFENLQISKSQQKQKSQDILDYDQQSYLEYTSNNFEQNEESLKSRFRLDKEIQQKLERLLKKG